MNTTITHPVTTALAGIRSVEDFALGTDPQLVELWASTQFDAGKARQANPTKISSRAWQSKSEPFAAGFAYAEALAATTADSTVEDHQWLVEHDCNSTVTATLARFQARIDADLAAQALAADSAAASMAPLMAHYESEALQEAMGVLSAYGSFDADGAFQPVIVRPLDADAEPLAKAKGMPVAWGRQKVVERLSRKVRDEHVLPRGRVSLQFSVNDDTEVYGDRLHWIPGTPELVFIVMEDGSKAAQRGEHVWAYYFIPAVNMVPDRLTGELVPRSSWYNDKGWVGVARTFATYEAAEEAIADLATAIRTVRDADSERIRALQADVEPSESDADRLDRLYGADGELAPRPVRAPEPLI